jgi:hypothetical protein
MEELNLIFQALRIPNPLPNKGFNLNFSKRSFQISNLPLKERKEGKILCNKIIESTPNETIIEIKANLFFRSSQKIITANPTITPLTDLVRKMIAHKIQSDILFNNPPLKKSGWHNAR